MTDTISKAEAVLGIQSGLAREVAAAGHEDVFSCYQCQKCTNGCPVSFAMDYHPHQVIRMVQFGLADEVSRIKSVWVCASCETCYTRCPNEIDIPALMDHLKQRVIRQGKRPVEGAVAAFHQAFLNNIRKHGRIHEAGLMRDYFLMAAKAEKRIGIKEMLRNIKLGFTMFKKGRLSLLPERTGGKKAVQELFERKN